MKAHIDFSQVVKEKVYFSIRFKQEVRLRSITTHRTIDGSSNSISLMPQLIDHIKLLKRTEMPSKKRIRKNARYGIDEEPKDDEYQQRPSFWIEGYGCSAQFCGFRNDGGTG